MGKYKPSPQWLLRLRQSILTPRSIANRKMLLLLLALSLVVGLAAAWRVKRRADLQLAEERARREKSNLIPFEQKRLKPINSKAIEIWQNHRSSRAVVNFNDSYFVASDGGLIELDETGKLLRHYTVLDGLPESDLVSLAVFNTKLFIGTRTQGLVAFDGAQFDSYRWTDRTSQSIDALLADGGRLLIGTRSGGLIAFDGHQFKELTAGIEQKRLLEINLLSKHGLRLFVGTFADGLWIEEAGRWSHFTTANGLLSNRVVGVGIANQNLFVATDFGLTVASVANLSTEDQTSPSLFLTIVTIPSLSSMVLTSDSVVFSKDNAEIFSFRTDLEIRASRQVMPLAWLGAGNSFGTRLISLDKYLWLLSEEGLYRASADHASGGRFLAWGPERNDRLTSNLVSALTIDSQDRLWVGSFRRGIDVLKPQGVQLAHMESETNREINSLTKDEASNTIIAASSAGLLRFDSSLRTTEHWSTKDGLLSNAVLQVARREVDDENAPNLIVATSKGLSLGTRRKLRGLTTVHGLPSNSLYAVLVQGRKTYVGTLGGLAVVEDGRVLRVFKDTNSKLTTNWVTAISVVGSRIFVGTYGGGLFELNAGGELRSFAKEVGRVVVNPNAMWSDGSQLFVGTLDGALVFEPATQQWTQVKAELPSQTVLSVTGNDKYVYLGTTGGIVRIERSYWNRDGN